MTKKPSVPSTDLSKFPRKPFSPLKLQLDPRNPRLSPAERGSSQPKLLEIMIRRFNVEEVAESIVASGYVPLDPLIGWNDKHGPTIREGNRRVAALQLLLEPGRAPDRFQSKWAELSKLAKSIRESLAEVEVIMVPDPDLPEVLAYIGFRHVAGNLQWPAYEKAAYIAYLIDDHGLSYYDAGRQIGSRSDAVERHYVAFRLVAQAREQGAEGVDNMEGAFGVLLRSLNAPGTRDFLGVTYPGDPARSRTPCPSKKVQNLRDFVTWTFGSEEKAPIVTDSRQLTQWGRILKSDSAVTYLRTAPNPRFDRALFKAGGERDSITESLTAAADRLEEAVPHVRRHRQSNEIRDLVKRCAYFFYQIIEHFPQIREQEALPNNV